MIVVERPELVRHLSMRNSVLAPAVTILCLGGCAGALSPSAFEDGSPQMRPEVFFAGTTRSSGVIEDRSGAPTQRLHVQGEGHVSPTGTFQLTQIVTLDGSAPQTRTWLIHRSGEHQYTGTLSDASGPIVGEAYGDLFHLRYSMTSPAGGRMEQWLYLQPDGHTVVNEATVTLLGVVVARISERITQESGLPATQ